MGAGLGFNVACTEYSDFAIDSLELLKVCDLGIPESGDDFGESKPSISLGRERGGGAPRNGRRMRSILKMITEFAKPMIICQN